MRICIAAAACATVLVGWSANAKTAVFWEDGFPVVDSVAVSQESLASALAPEKPAFVNADALAQTATLGGVDLLVLPYGSAFPEAVWPSILAYLQGGGNLLVLGGIPFAAPVAMRAGQFVREQNESAYSRALGILHTYQAPQTDYSRFGWKYGYTFLPAVHVRAAKYFVLEGRNIDGLGYMLDTSGDKIAAPVVVTNHTAVSSGQMAGTRWVFLDFEPEAGFWDSADGVTLIRTAAAYAREGAKSFWIETEYAAVRPGETPQLIVHLEEPGAQRKGMPLSGDVKVELLSGDTVIATRTIECGGSAVHASVDFDSRLPGGFYYVRAIYEREGAAQDFYENGFWVGDAAELNSGPVLGVEGDFLTNDGAPFFPFGTNYFTTEEDGWDFSGPRNAAVWERDFAEMQKHGVSFVRTGVWNGSFKFLNPDGEASERFLRNVEAYLRCAHAHGIAVNFTFFAFDPQTTLRAGEDHPLTSFPGTNPYLDPIAIQAEENYALSIVNRFKDVPYLSWDLINEPSFSNPTHLWHGNTPNGDAAELRAWHSWLRDEYHELARLADAWCVTPEQLGSFDDVPLPSEQDLTFNLEQGQVGQNRAYDYNLFAQDMFGRWVKQMVAAVRSTGSKQLIDVGQDEGGVMNRLLNQFYGETGLSFTTNHTYRQNSALLWDSLAAKAPGVPNITGETGYQPVILPDGEWHYDEITGAPLIERKWAFGFAGGSSGALSWDWAREIYFGIKRSDGSDKIWEDMMRAMGATVAQMERYAGAIVEPDVAIVLPQSLQLSVFNGIALAAQRNSVRALYGYAHSQAYAAGEDQLALLGSPKLIILPSPWILTDEAWAILMQKVKAGATLLVSGPFDQDPHFRSTRRAAEIGIPYERAELFTRDNTVAWPNGSASLVYSGQMTEFLNKAVLPGGATFAERTLGSGKILFVALPVELNENLAAVGAIYSYALNVAKVRAAYTTAMTDSGLLICPTEFPHATLYVLSSETEQTHFSFRDGRSGKEFSGELQPGHAALLLISDAGQELAAYNWNGTESAPAAGLRR